MLTYHFYVGNPIYSAMPFFIVKLQIFGLHSKTKNLLSKTLDKSLQQH